MAENRNVRKEEGRGFGYFHSATLDKKIKNKKK